MKYPKDVAMTKNNERINVTTYRFPILFHGSSRKKEELPKEKIKKKVSKEKIIKKEFKKQKRRILPRPYFELSKHTADLNLFLRLASMLNFRFSPTSLINRKRG